VLNPEENAMKSDHHENLICQEVASLNYISKTEHD